MNKLIALVLFVIAFGAQAQTNVTLMPLYCGAMPACNGVPDDPSDYSVSLATNYLANNGVKAVINGIIWDSGPIAGDGLDFSAGVALYDGQGGVATFTGTFTHTAKAINAGRLHMYRQIWTFNGGTIVLP